jgi:hypothetical protein
MTKALVLKSRLTENGYERFGSGAGEGDLPSDHNLARLPP